MAITFDVSEVERSTEPLETTGADESIRALLGEGLSLEAWSKHQLVSDPARGWRWHPFIAAADCAFRNHLPLVISPDGIWLCVAQAIASDIRNSAEQRSAAELVPLEVRLDEFLPGSPDNPWPEIFDSFAGLIGQRHRERRDLVMAEFSTTGVIERAAFAVTLMDAMQDFYRYVGTTLCGIPAITLEGTAADYRAIRDRVAGLKRRGPKGWAKALVMVCEQLIAAAEGKPDIDFFRSLYKINSDSGGPYMNGWINVLFPYQWDYEEERFSQPNHAATRWRWPDLDASFAGGKQKSAPLGISRAPLLWRVLAPPTEYRYELLAGFVGVSQARDTLAVRAEIGWAVRRA